MESEEREIGFYWIEQSPDIYEPAYWNGKFWALLGTNDAFKDNNLLAMGDKIETPIKIERT